MRSQLNGATGKKRNMRKLIIATLVILLAGLSPVMLAAACTGRDARPDGSANPTSRLTNAGSPPHRDRRSATSSANIGGRSLAPDCHAEPTPEEAAVDRAIGNICRGVKSKPCASHTGAILRRRVNIHRYCE